MIDGTACQPIWVMLYRNKLYQNLWKMRQNITPSVDV